MSVDRAARAARRRTGRECCQAGCQTENMMETTGLERTALFPAPSSSSRQIEETYEYTNEDGELLSSGQVT